jgi:L-amino acid N-acyltransferase YncA
METIAMESQEQADREPMLTRVDKAGELFGVRPYRASDREALVQFYERFEPKRAAQGLPPLGAERVERWLNQVLPQGIHLVALRDGQLLGHALVVPMEQPGASEYAVFVRQDQRGRGMGTELNRIAIEVARAAGIRRLWLSVEPHNRAALRSYEKVGFRMIPHTAFSPEAEMQMELQPPPW